MPRQTLYVVQMFISGGLDEESRLLKIFTNRKSAFEYAVTQLDDYTTFDVKDEHDRVDWELVKLVPENKIFNNKARKANKENVILVEKRHVYDIFEYNDYSESDSDYYDDPFNWDFSESDDSNDEPVQILPCIPYVEMFDRDRRAILEKTRDWSPKQIDRHRDVYDEFVAEAEEIRIQCLKEQKVDLATDWRRTVKSEN